MYKPNMYKLTSTSPAPCSYTYNELEQKYNEGYNDGYAAGYNKAKDIYSQKFKEGEIDPSDNLRRVGQGPLTY